MIDEDIIYNLWKYINVTLSFENCIWIEVFFSKLDNQKEIFIKI